MLFDDIVIAGNRAICKSYAKINLTLDILGKRENGYHDIETIMQTVSLFDLVIVDTREDEIKVKTNASYLPCDERNTAYKAAKLFFEKSGIKGGASILIHKNIPVAAGLAGGSGNAAAVLCALNELYGYPFTREKLVKLSAEIGADVPYCMIGSTVLATGVGEILTSVSPMPGATVLLVKPPVSVLSGEVYKEYDLSGSKEKPDTDMVLHAIKKKNLKAVAGGLCNVFESIVEEKHPEIRKIKEEMKAGGALGALMSGSGPTVFGLFDDEVAAKKCADKFFERYKEVYLCKILNQNCK